jgi:hypothetical protein
MTNILMTKEEYNEYLLNEFCIKAENEVDILFDRYLLLCAKIRSDEDYIRTNWENIMETHYDGTDIQEVTLRLKNPKTTNTTKFGTIKFMDNKLRKGRAINVVKMITYLITINEIREIIYNNNWGIVVRDPKKNNYPEKIVLTTIKDIIVEGLNFINGKEKEKALLMLDAAPIDSIAGKAWNMIPTVTLNPVIGDNVPKASGAYESLMSAMTNEQDEEEIIPKEDVEFWRNIYRTRKHLTYGKEFKVC